MAATAVPASVAVVFVATMVAVSTPVVVIVVVVVVVVVVLADCITDHSRSHRACSCCSWIHRLHWVSIGIIAGHATGHCCRHKSQTYHPYPFRKNTCLHLLINS